jgi:uncharacterized Zn finger protein
MTHGTATGYAKHGCRCVACTRAQRERMREYRQRRTDAIVSDVGATNRGTTQMCPGDAPTSRGVDPREVSP